MRPPVRRLISLDAFRGYTVAAMIMVNFPGSWDHVFPTLRHSKWNGLTFTDLVAPFFLFIVGVSICLAYAEKVEHRIPKAPIYKKIVFRALKIFALGMFLNAWPHFDLANLRWTGTLHRIAFVFLACALLFLHTTWKQQLWLTVILLLGYWLAMTQIPTPGFGKVMLEPGQNLAAWVDSQYLPGKMWQGTWDPEGILSTFPALATSLTGVLAGRLLRLPMEDQKKVNFLFTGGLAMSIVGYFLGLVFPINENLWTSSFVLVTSGMASMVLAAVYFLADILNRKQWFMPGVVFGTNAITAYVLGDLLAPLFYGLPRGGPTLNERVVKGLTSIGVLPELASWIYALAYVSFLFLLVWILYRKKIFIKI